MNGQDATETPFPLNSLMSNCGGLCQPHIHTLFVHELCQDDKEASVSFNEH